MFWRPEAFPRWASGLSNAALEQTDAGWKGQGPEGPITVTFSDHNEFGVMDHWVDVGNGNVFYIPLRIIPNASGSEVMLTLFQHPGMTDEKFADDQEWVKRDLEALKALAEQGG
ncbi:polyketide cyclase [Pseudochelatococcus sp. B33]